MVLSNNSKVTKTMAQYHDAASAPMVNMIDHEDGDDDLFVIFMGCFEAMKERKVGENGGCGGLVFV